MKPRFVLTCLFTLLATPWAMAQAVTWFTWDSGDNTNRWDRPANWVGDAVPPDANTTGVAFGTGNQTIVDTRQNRTLNSLRFDAGAAPFTITNNQLGFSAASGSASISQLSSNLQTVSSGVGVGASLSVDVSGSGQLRFTGALSGANDITKIGTGGDWVLAGNGSAYTGNIWVNEGTARAASNSALGANAGFTTVASGARLSIGSLSSSNLVISENIRVSGAGVGGGGALVNLGNTNTLTGSLTLLGSSRVQSNAGTLNLSGGVTGAGHTLTVGGSGNTTISGAIATGAGGLNKEGTGTLRLAASNSYTGATTLSGGTTIIQASNVFSDTSLLTINAGSLLNLNGMSETVGGIAGDGRIEFSNGKLTLNSGASTFGGDFTGSGTLVVRAGATLTLTDSFNNSNLSILLDGGTLNLGNGLNQTFGNLTVASSSVIDFGTGGATSAYFNSIAIQNGQTLTVNNWADGTDFFYVQNNPGPQGTPPTNHVDFTNYPVDTWTGNDTRWIPFANGTYGQLTPVPEPSTYGAIFLGLMSGWVMWRRKKSANTSRSSS